MGRKKKEVGLAQGTQLQNDMAPNKRGLHQGAEYNSHFPNVSEGQGFGQRENEETESQL